MPVTFKCQPLPAQCTAPFTSKEISCVRMPENYKSRAGAPKGESARRKPGGGGGEEDGRCDCKVACHGSRHVPTLLSARAREGRARGSGLRWPRFTASDCHVTGLRSPPAGRSLCVRLNGTRFARSLQGGVFVRPCRATEQQPRDKDGMTHVLARTTTAHSV